MPKILRNIKMGFKLHWKSMMLLRGPTWVIMSHRLRVDRTVYEQLVRALGANSISILLQIDWGGRRSKQLTDGLHRLLRQQFNFVESSWCHFLFYNTHLDWFVTVQTFIHQFISLQKQLAVVLFSDIFHQLLKTNSSFETKSIIETCWPRRAYITPPKPNQIDVLSTY